MVKEEFCVHEHCFSKRVSEEYKRVEKEIQLLEHELSGLPEGKLVCAGNGKYTKWYRSDGKKLVYIPKKEKALAKQLAVKRYLTTRLEDLIQERRAILFYLRHHKDEEKSAAYLLHEESPYAPLLSDHFMADDQKMYDWVTAPYKQNGKYPEQCIYKTNVGCWVRSKSEALIAMLLYQYRIPFRYECELELGDITIYPDFTIMHPQTGQVFYWEHFGMMDNPNYSQNTMNKLHLYISNNIIPSVQLLTSYETKEFPLDVSMVEHMIRHYFL